MLTMALTSLLVLLFFLRPQRIFSHTANVPFKKERKKEKKKANLWPLQPGNKEQFLLLYYPEPRSTTFQIW
jgi:hypothetical protein